jgi:hypothetical protein
MQSADIDTFTWRDYAAAAGLALAIVIGASLRMVPGVVGVIDDDAVYSVTGKALAEGDGYRLVNLPGAPRQTKYPILYPAVLSLAWRLGDSLESRIFAMQATTTALASLALAMAYLYCVRFRVSARGPAFAGCLLAASAPNLLFYCSQTVSEMPFLALLVLALWTTESRLRAPVGTAIAGSPPPSSAGRDLLAGVALALPYLSRTVGIVIPIVAIGLLARTRRPVRWIVLGALCVILPWLVWVAGGVKIGSDAVVGYQTDYFGWWRANGSLVVALTNLFKSGLAFAHIDLEGFARALYDRTDSARWILIVVGTFPWLVVARRSRSFELLPVTMLAYLALLCLWPWPPDRFLVPLLPFLGAFAFQAIRDGVARRASQSVGDVVLVLLAAGFLVANFGTLTSYASAARATQYPFIRLVEEPARWQTYQAAFQWLRERSKSDDVIAAGFDTMTALYTDRTTIRPFVIQPLSIYYDFPGLPIGTSAELADHLAKYDARYLFLSPMPGYPTEVPFHELVYELAEKRPGLLKPVWQPEEDLRFVIFEVSPTT